MRVTATAGDGEETLLAERGAGEILGELSGIDGQPRSASVTAIEEVRGLVVLRGGQRVQEGRVVHRSRG